jgi:hypothetical protein
MSVSNTLALILCGIVIVVLICLKSYVQYRNEDRNHVAILPITTPNRVVDNTFEEAKIPDNDFYRVNI